MKSPHKPSPVSKKMKEYEKMLARQTVPKYEVSSEELLRFTYEEPSRHARWTYRLEGTHYGKKWSAHLTHEGLKHLVKLMVEAL
jgi:hypothetical protein